MLTPRVKHHFRPVIRARGDAYASGKRTTIVAAESNRVEARVRGGGGRAYEIELRVLPGPSAPALGLACSCPHFEQGEWCKHLWATLRTLDLQGWRAPELEVDGREPLLVVDLEERSADPDEDEDDLDPDPDEDLDATDDALRRHLLGRLLPAPRGPRERRVGWQARIERLASPLSALGAAGGLSRAADLYPAVLGGSAAPLLYLLDLDSERSRDEIRLHFARQPTRRDGSPGALGPARLGREDAQRAGDAGEAAAIAQLLTLAGIQAPGGGSAFGYGISAYDAYTARTSTVVLPHAFLDPILPRLAATGRLALLPPRTGFSYHRDTPLTWLRADDGDPWRLRLRLEPAASGSELRATLVRGDETLGIEAAEHVLGGGFLVLDGRLARADLGSDLGGVAELRNGPLVIPPTALDAALQRLATTPVLASFELAPGLPWRSGTSKPVPRLRFDAAAEGARTLSARLDFAYGEAWVEAQDPFPRLADRSSRTLFARDAESETQAIGALRELGFGPAGPGRPDRLAIPASVFETAAHELLAKGWILEVEGERLRRPGRTAARVRSGIDFFDLQGSMDFEGTAVPFPSLLAAVRRKERFVRLADGSRGLLPRVWLERCAGLAQVALEADDALRFARAQAPVLAALLAAQDEARADRHFEALRRKLDRFAGIEPASAPRSFAGVLRGYQSEGLGWLRFLEEFSLGGCLADDMGLGKTVQVLALLAGRGRRLGRRGAARPSLVVAPRSVVHGWIAEAARFAPSLRVLRYDGPARAELREGIPDHDLVVTTYGTLLRDADALAGIDFDYAILDEAHAIKNAASRTARAAKSLRADHRLALTGTPVENHLGELASLLEFLNPGLLGRSRHLRTLASGRASAALVARLAPALRPLVMRRTKEQVLAELPPKTEQTLFCDLGGAQRTDYEELRRHYQASLARRVERDGMNRSRMHVLEALLRLRQAACHPALIDPKRTADASAKLDLLFEQLQEIRSEGHKALVFSQFTSFLALVRARLEAQDVPHAYLDGRTRDRQARIARFQDDPDCALFLISLKAGGTGLNLTAADYVFLLDPWWNPAVEAQAIDRTHRIGQQRPVFAYRLVARDTIEERILELQARKRALAESLFDREESLVASLTADDLRVLLG